ncbi:hypothetical protein IFM47457_02074 [Aspergillus lentulus]|nr:hypothetical protein IFM47457_02074 [Aspergillus lentulus]
MAEEYITKDSPNHNSVWGRRRIFKASGKGEGEADYQANLVPGMEEVDNGRVDVVVGNTVGPH